jgi:uncharacterized protein YjhX (UPF0386 family)
MGQAPPSAMLADALVHLHSRISTSKMDISRDEQRVLHALAQGGVIKPLKNFKGRIDGLQLYNREGWLMPVTLPLFKKLQRKKAIKSQDGQPYRITRRGLELVRSEVDNR